MAEQRVSEALNLGLQAIENEMHSSSSDNDTSAVESLYNRTMGAFSSNRNRTSSRSGKKKKPGRIPKDLSFHMFLLAKRSDFLPPLSELDRLTRNGLGSPRHELPGLLETGVKKTSIHLSKTMTDLEDLIMSSYQSVPLGVIGFTLARVNEGKRLEDIYPDSMLDLKVKLKKGKLWVIPKREIVLPLGPNTSRHAGNISQGTENTGTAVGPNTSRHAGNLSQGTENTGTAVGPNTSRRAGNLSQGTENTGTAVGPNTSRHTGNLSQGTENTGTAVRLNLARYHADTTLGQNTESIGPTRLPNLDRHSAEDTSQNTENTEPTMERSPVIGPLRRSASRLRLRRTRRTAAARCRRNISSYAATIHVMFYV